MHGYPRPDRSGRAPARPEPESGRVYGGGGTPATGSARPAERPGSAGAASGSARVGAGSGAGRTGTARAGKTAGGRGRTGAASGAGRGGAGGGRGNPAGRGGDRPGGADAGGDKRSRSRRTPVWATLTITFGALLTLLSGTALAGYGVLHDRYAGNVQQENLLGGAAVASEAGEELDGPINVLLLGTDARSEDSDDIRSDTIIVLHIPSSHDQAYLISVPRDTWVSVPGYWDMKITEAFGIGFQEGGGLQGGVQLVAATLNQMAGLSFDAAAIINFPGFEKIIDELGGIEYCVTDATVSEHYVLVNGERMGVGKARREGYWDTQPVQYEEGCQQMEGWQALDYVRQRKNLASGDGDYGRQRNQQQLLQAMMKQASSSDVRTNFATLDRLLLAAGDAVVVDTNGVDMIDFLFTVRNVRPGDLVSLRTNGGEYNSQQIDGKSVELLTPESLAMFEAAANDDMAQFIVHNPDFVSSD